VRHAILAVEGQHDIEVIGRVLRAYGFAKVQVKAKLDAIFHELIPTKYPANQDGNILSRVPVPVFYQSDDVCVAMLYCEGDSQIISRMSAAMTRLRMTSLGFTPFAIGIVLDSDKHVPMQRFSEIAGKIASVDASLIVPARPGEVSEGVPRVGIYIMPNNKDAGTLEDILIECADVCYGDLLRFAREFVCSARPCVESLEKKDREHFQSPSGEKKATVSVLSSLLRPGKAIQVSICDNQWIPKQPDDFSGQLMLVAFFISRLLDMRMRTA
jgi:hypothetical protein